jgi:hypothetical protein
MTLYRRYLVTISSLEVDSISKVTATFPDAAAPLRAWLYVSIHTTASRAASATYTRARRGHDTAVQRAHSGNLQSIMQSRGSSGVRSGDDRVDLDVWESVRVTMLNGRGVGVPAAALRSPVAHARSHMRSATARHTPDPDAARAPLAAVSGLRDCDGSRPGDWPASPSIRSPAAPLHALTSHLRRYGVRVNASINREARTHPSVPRPNIFERGHMPAGPSENSHSIDLIR